ncbi:MAG: hypothetical protein R6X03_02805 [Methyloceanibacter sp.]
MDSLKPRRSVAVFAARVAATALLSVTAANVALAEFEIQESTIDPGEIQLQYRGAWHSGLPRGSQVVDEDILPDDEEAPLRQSHEFELQMSPTTYWLVAITHGFDQPINGDFRLSAIEVETQFELITLEERGIGFAIQGGVEKPVFEAAKEDPPDFHVGPILEAIYDKFQLTLNPMFFKDLGSLADQTGWGFEYGWQAKYELAGRWSLALEMFGEIDDMANAGPFDQQLHSIGPALYWTIEAEGDGITVPKSREFTLSLGGQFGLTSETPDFAVKAFIGYEYF